MNVFMDMWRGLLDPQRISVDDKSDKIIENMNEALRLEDELEKKISRENFAIFKSIMGRRLMVSECYKYIAFKQGFIVGNKLAKEIEEFENLDEVREINNKIEELNKNIAK